MSKLGAVPVWAHENNCCQHRKTREVTRLRLLIFSIRAREENELRGRRRSSREEGGEGRVEHQGGKGLREARHDDLESGI